MAQPNHNLSDDIAFMRSLAEAGRDRPMVGGSILLAAGAIYGAASLTVWGLLVAGALAYGRAKGELPTVNPVNFNEPLGYVVKPRVPPIPQSPINGRRFAR